MGNSDLNQTVSCYKAMGKLAIVGSRDFPNANLIREFVRKLKKTTTVISGGARGVDSVAAEEAKLCGLTTEIYPANWALYGKSAGFRRNKTIVDNADGLVAFWDGESKGTLHSINLAKEKKIWGLIIYPNGKQKQL